MGWFDSRELKEAKKEEKRIQKLEDEKIQEHSKALGIKDSLRLYENYFCIDKLGRPFIYRDTSSRDNQWFVWISYYWSKPNTSSGSRVKDLSFEGYELIRWIKDGRDRFLTFKSYIDKFDLELKQKEIENDI